MLFPAVRPVFLVDLAADKWTYRREIEGLQVPERFLDLSLAFRRVGGEWEVPFDHRHADKDRFLFTLIVGSNRLLDGNPSGSVLVKNLRHGVDGLAMNFDAQINPLH